MSTDRDVELGAALRALPTPDHGADFWADLERRLDEEPTPAGDELADDGSRFTGRGRAHRRRPRPSAGRWLLSAAAAVAVLVAAVAVLRPSDGDRRIIAGPPPSVTPAEQTWTVLSMSGLAPRRGHVAVWTGQEMIVWGGRDFDSRFNDGAAYDPVADRWVPLPPAPLAGGPNYNGVWTGSKLVVFGSVFSDVDGRASLTNEGATYDPSTRTWTPIAKWPLVARSGHTAVWTGDRMLVWGGGGLEERTFADGAAYDPTTDRWTMIPPAPIGERDGHSAVWTGSRMVVWGGGCCEEGGDPTPADGAAFDAGARRWEPVPAGPLSARSMHTAVWTGDRMLVWGGFTSDGAAYFPETRKWERLDDDARIQPRLRHSAVWTGSQMLVWGGEGPGGTYADGSAYDPARDAWQGLADAPISARGGHTAVWTGDAMLVWGGSNANQAFFADGAAYHSGR